MDNHSNTLNQILEELKMMKGKLPNGELEAMNNQIKYVKEYQQDLKNDIQEIKKKLFNPEDGVIVKVNEARKYINKQEEKEEEYDQIILDLDSVKKWQSGVNKALWIFFGALTGLTIQLLMILYSTK
jgi:flagellar biosynthesis/type III secretory pathway M-ring protein FliF/YscJ